MVNIGSLIPSGNKQLPHPMLIHYWCPMAFTLEQYHSQCQSYYSVYRVLQTWFCSQFKILRKHWVNKPEQWPLWYRWLLTIEWWRGQSQWCLVHAFILYLIILTPMFYIFIAMEYPVTPILCWLWFILTTRQYLALTALGYRPACSGNWTGEETA